MAQLVKLQDYVSRYQNDLKRYPTQFVRLKNIQWDHMKSNWESGEEISEWEHEEEVEKQSKSFLQRLLPFNRRKKQYVEDSEEAYISENRDEPTSEENNLLNEFFQPKILYYPQTIEELRRMYMDQLFQFQLKWASATLREKSYINPKFYRDALLRAFIQRLPDSYFLFYYPIFQIKKAPIEMGILLLTPTECICIQVLEEENEAVFVGDGSRFWAKKIGKIDKKVLNPFIGLNRMESIVKQVFKTHEIDLPIRKVVLSRNGYIDYPGSIYGIEMIDKRKYKEWFTHLKKNPSPMKHMQFKAAQCLLNKVQTTSFQRLDEDEDEQTDAESSD
ncbi:NERD domain-containing protein [Rummeliibacillus sp. JY-2-4R]